MEDFEAIIKNHLGYAWATAVVIALTVNKVLVWFFNEEGESPWKTTRRLWFVFLPINFFIFGLPFYYEVVAPILGNPQPNKFVIRIALFEPVASDADTASRNFPDSLNELIKDLNDPEIDVQTVNIKIEGSDENEVKASAKKIGLRDSAHLVIFGRVRCNDDFHTECDKKYSVKTEIVLTEGPIYPGKASINFISNRDFIELPYSEVTKIRNIVRFIQGMKKYQMGNYETARNIFRSLPDDNEEFLFYLGNTERLTGHKDAAFLAYDKAIKRKPNTETYINKGNLFADEGKYNEALNYYNEALKLQPNRFEALFNKANILAKLAKYNEALICYDAAIKNKPDFVGAFINKGNVFLTINKNSEAILCFDKALSLRKDSLAYNNKGNALKNLGEFANAVACYDMAVRLNPNLAEAYYNKGDALDYIDKHVDAIACYDMAIKLKPNLVEAYNNKGNSLTDLGKFNEAIVCFDKAIRLKPEYAEAYNNKGIVFLIQRQFNEAIMCFDKAIYLKPDYANAFKNKGTALIMLNRNNEARDSFRRARELDPNTVVPSIGYL